MKTTPAGEDSCKEVVDGGVITIEVLDDVNDSPNPRNREGAGLMSNAQLRRSAGSQSVESFRQALDEWIDTQNKNSDDYSILAARERLDAMASEDGKNVLHMAAWQGCLENVELLVEEFGCHINPIATGLYSYGKTPIFFAATRSRDEIVSYLLQHGAHVKIVNNKGQTLLSIASSHLQASTIAQVQQAELDQSHLEWINYRISHSDGLEYGDLDPRFLDRPLRPTDVATSLAVNPTTKQSRRGSFLKRNPQLLQEHQQKQGGKKQESCGEKRPKSRARPQRQQMSAMEEHEISQAWKALEQSPSACDALLAILRISDQRSHRQPWIQEVAVRLYDTVPNPSDREQLFHDISTGLHEKDSRIKILLGRLQAKVQCQTLRSAGIDLNEAVGTRLKRVPKQSSKLVYSTAWSVAYDRVKGLSITADLVNDISREYLSLPKLPLWVDTCLQLDEMMIVLDSVRLVAFDAEWASNIRRHHFPMEEHHPRMSSRVSTLQLASRNSHNQQIQVWVVDLLHPDPQYQSHCRKVVTQLFTHKLMLGFALGRDIPKLKDWLVRENDGDPRDTAQMLSRNCLDLQTRFASHSSCMPGLASCVKAIGAPLPLSKVEQRSNWDCRPLRDSQLLYAGLDAAILLYSLASMTPSPPPP